MLGVDRLVTRRGRPLLIARSGGRFDITRTDRVLDKFGRDIAGRTMHDHMAVRSVSDPTDVRAYQTGTSRIVEGIIGQDLTLSTALDSGRQSIPSFDVLPHEFESTGALFVRTRASTGASLEGIYVAFASDDEDSPNTILKFVPSTQTTTLVSPDQLLRLPMILRDLSEHSTRFASTWPDGRSHIVMVDNDWTIRVREYVNNVVVREFETSMPVIEFPSALLDDTGDEPPIPDAHGTDREFELPKIGVMMSPGGRYLLIGDNDPERDDTSMEIVAFYIVDLESDDKRIFTLVLPNAPGKENPEWSAGITEEGVLVLISSVNPNPRFFGDIPSDLYIVDIAAAVSQLRHEPAYTHLQIVRRGGPHGVHTLIAKSAAGRRVITPRDID